MNRMSLEYRKVSINLAPRKNGSQTGFIDKVKYFIDDYLKSKDYQALVNEKKIFFTWYDDSPTSDGISIGVNFNILEGVDLVGALVIALRKEGYEIIGVTVGY